MLPQFTLVEHLTEIRKRLIKTLIAFIAIFIYVYTKTDQLIDFILDMATKIDFIYTKPEELLMSYLKLDFLAALLLTVPIFMFQCWRFVRPALKKNERLKCLIFFLMATILFFAGASFSLFITTPLCLRFLSEFTNYKIDPMLSIENYLSFIINMTTVFGIVFDVPAVIYFLASINLIRYSTIKKYGKYIILIMLVLAAVLTPPDVISQIMLFIPLLLLYELSLFICYVLERKNEKRIKRTLGTKD